MCRPIQCVCTSLGPTKPRQDDLDSIFQERRRKITLVGKLSSTRNTQAVFGAVRSIGMRTSIIPAALAAGERGGVVHTSYSQLEHSSGPSLA